MAPHISISALLRSVRRLLATVLLGVVVVAGIGAAVVAQAGREEATRADTAILMLDGAEDGLAARLDWAVRLYLDGQISRIVLVGSEPAPAYDALIARGVLQDKLAQIRETTQISQLAAARRMLMEARVLDAMLICEPIESLRLLKIARDQQLELHSAPVGADNDISLRDMVDEIGRYLIYCFVGR